MSVSVVTVTLNAAKDLPLTIESIAAQTHPDLEYIVLDGLSTDDTETVLARYAEHIDKVVRFEDAGVYQAMNWAAKLATKDYIVFINAGDRFVDEHAVARMFSRLEKGVDVFYGDHVYIDKGLETFTRSTDFDWLRRRLLDGQIDGRWHSRIPGHQATFTRTTLLRELPYDERFTICADHHFLLRAYDRGAKFQYIDEPVAQYFGGGFSSKNGAKLQREWALAYRSYSLRPARVDEYMFQGAGNSPYPPMHAYSGMVIDGVFPREGPYPEHGPLPVCWASIPRVRSPKSFHTGGLTVAGFNRIDRQELKIKHEGRQIGVARLPLGNFNIYVPFEDLLPNDCEIVIYPDQIAPLSKEDGRVASFMLVELYFKPIVPQDLEPFSILGCNHDMARALLKSGWSHIEDAHVWSVDPAAKLSLPPLPRPRRLVLEVGSSHLFDENQWVTIFLNGRDVGRHDVGRRGEPMDIFVDDLDGWREGVNELTLKVASVRSVATEGRKLGVSLHGFRFEK